MSTETKKSGLPEVLSTVERTGCDRVGCTMPVTIGQVMGQGAKGRIFHHMHECNGFIASEVEQIGAAYIVAVRAGTTLPEVPEKTPKAKRVNVNAEKVAAAIETGSLTEDQEEALLAALLTKRNAAKAQKATTPVRSKSAPRK